MESICNDYAMIVKYILVYELYHGMCTDSVCPIVYSLRRVQSFHLNNFSILCAMNVI